MWEWVKRILVVGVLTAPFVGIPLSTALGIYAAETDAPDLCVKAMYATLAATVSTLVSVWANA